MDAVTPLVAPSTILAYIVFMIALFSGADATAGSNAASRAAVRLALSVNSALKFVGITVNSSDSSTAVPSVPPIWRKNVEALVATPMSRSPTEFWLAIVRVCMS